MAGNRLKAVDATPPRLHFYFDYISSNAYLAWHRMPGLQERLGIEVVPVPVLFAGLLDAYGQLGPAEVPPKALWTWRNNRRKAALLEQTDAAIRAGVFGVPAMRVGSEVFWGFDDLPYLELVLAGRDPIAAEEATNPERPPAFAQRRPFRPGA